MMEKPTWVKVIGVLGIIFGCTGLLGAMLTVITPAMMDFQQKVMEGTEKQAEEDAQAEAFFDFYRQFWDMPDWCRTWMVVYGAVSIPAYGFYLVAAIWFISVKRNAIKRMYWALGLSMGLTALGAVLRVFSGGFLASIAAAGTWSIVLDLVLLIVIIVSDKTVFYQDDAPAPATP